MSSSSEIRKKLAGYPESVLEDFDSFKKSGDSQALYLFVFGLIQFMQDSSEAAEDLNVNDDTRLKEDMGIDSITIVEVAFLLEEIFEIKIQDEELMEIVTVGQLRDFVVKKVT